MQNPDFQNPVFLESRFYRTCNMSLVRLCTANRHASTSSTCTKSTKNYIDVDTSSPTASPYNSRNLNDENGIIEYVEWYLWILIMVMLIKTDINGTDINKNAIYGCVWWYFMVYIMMIWTIFGMLMVIYGNNTLTKDAFKYGMNNKKQSY